MSTAVRVAFAARHIYAVPASKFARLDRLGLLRRRAGGFDLEELREDLELLEEIDRQIATVGRDLTPTERNGALAWLAALVRAGGDQNRPAHSAMEMIEKLTPP